MKRLLYIPILVIMTLWCSKSSAQVLVNIKIDSLQLLIGEQTGITLDVTCDDNENVSFPQLQKGSYLVPGVEVVDVPQRSEKSLNEGKRMEYSQRYIVTSFDSALYHLPPMVVMVDSSEYLSNSLALKVYTVPIDTAAYDSIRERPFEKMPHPSIKGIEDVPFAWDDWKAPVYGSLTIIVILLLFFVMLVWLKQGNPIIRIIRHKPKLPPHQVAMTEIQRIKEEKTWAMEDSKEYYVQLTDVLRQYIQDRYGFSAMDMTSSEIIEKLTAENDVESLDELRQLFATADLVKFAKYTTMINENDANLLTAINYVNQTKLEVDPNAKSEEPTYTPEEMRSIGMKWTLRVLIALCAAGAITISVFLIIRLIDLLR